MGRRSALPLVALVLVLPALVLPPLLGMASPVPGARPASPYAYPPQRGDARSPLIKLRGGVFCPTEGQTGVDEGESLYMGTADGVETTSLLLVQYGQPILSEWRDALEATGVTILDYIPDYAYKVTCPPKGARVLRELPGVVWVGSFLPAYRCSPELVGPSDQLVRVELASQVASLPDLLADGGIQVIGREGQSLLVRANGAQVRDLSQLDQVRWIEAEYPLRVHNDVATGELRAPLAWVAGYTGEGQIVNVADTGLDTGIDYPQVAGDMHLDVDNRVAHIASWPKSSLYYVYLNDPATDDGAADLDSGHGTHVVGSAVGNGRRSLGQYRGLANRADLTFQALEQYCDFSPAGEAAGYSDGYQLLGVPADMAQLLGQAYDWGARVDTNSWGGGALGVYDERCRQTDRYVWEHRDLVVLFSTGNEGRDTDRDGRVDYGSITPPATAKNIIAVGGVENRRPGLPLTYGQSYADAFPVLPIRDDPMADAGGAGMMAISGRGPARDGRMLPHVVASGTWVASMRSSQSLGMGWGSINSYYMYNGGTSMSAPLVAGAAALVRQAYVSRGHAQPSAALTKATLIQTARDIPGQYPAPFGDAGPIPNNDEGWGLVDVQAAVAGGRAFSDEGLTLQTGQGAVHTYTVAASSSPVKVTLVWTDYPAAVESATQLVNDLDLEVSAPGGNLYRGNSFAGGWSAVGGSADRTNNVECVYLPSCDAGTLVVSVRGFNIPMGPQSYALLVTAPIISSTERLHLPLVHGRPPLPTVTPSSAPSATGTFTPAPTRTEPPSATATPHLARTATLVPSATLTPTLAPGEFVDDFGAVTGMWVVTYTSSYAFDYLSGEYRARLFEPFLRKGSLPAVACTGDLMLETDGRAANDAPQGYGLLFNHSAPAGVSRYHAFVVSPTGHYAVLGVDGVDAWMVMVWTSSPWVASGTARNRLSVVRVGEQVQCLVNGHLLTTLTGAEYTGGGGFGLLALSGERPLTDARFDNLRMVPLGGGLSSSPRYAAIIK